MATCPDCGGYLHEGHQCSGARRRLVRAILMAFAGAAIGLVGTFALSDRPTWSLAIVAAMLGAVLLTAVAKSVGF